MKSLLTKKMFCGFCLLALALPFTYSQNFTHEFGKYSGEEFSMKQYDKDPLAEAVVIYDIGKSYFVQTDYGFQLLFERRTKIKIFSKAGIRWAQNEILFYLGDREIESIEELKGNTYNYENGNIRITPLNPKNTYEEKIDENWRSKKFAMPDVKEGSVIEISYKIRSPYLFNLRNWEFQNKIPVIYSEYTTKMIPFYEYVYILQGTNKFDSFKSYENTGIAQQFQSIKYQDMVYEFVMKDVPAFRDEEYLSSPNDYMIKLNFQLAAIHRPDGVNKQIMTTWPKLVDEMLSEDSFGKYLKSCRRSAGNIIDTLNLTVRSPKEKADILERYVKNNFNWNGRKEKFSDKSIKDFLKTKTGNSADLNLYLAGLLTAAGIEAYPVLLSTRDHGKISLDYPFEHFFNYVMVIAHINDEYLYLDATESLCPFNQIPVRCINGKGLIVDKSKTAWVNFRSPVTSIMTDSMELKINDSIGEISGNFNIRTTGYEALTLRGNYLSDKVSLKKKLLNENFRLSDSIRVANVDNSKLPFDISYNAKAETEKIEDKLLISPFCDRAIAENPLKQPDRSYPVDMIYKKGHRFVSVIRIPKGYKLLSKPEDLIVNNTLSRIQYHAEQTDTENIKVTGYYEFKKDIYETQEYLYLKNVFSRIADKFNERLVLVKR